RQKAKSPDQAPKSVARLGVSHLHRRQVYGDRLNAGLSSRWREANARELREGKVAQVTARMKAIKKQRPPGGIGATSVIGSFSHLNPDSLVRSVRCRPYHS